VNNFFYNDQNALMCEGVPVAGLAAEYGTPLYVYSAKEIVDCYRNIQTALEGIPFHTAYALKANANDALLKVLIREGSRADVVSAGELMLALRAGFSHSAITFAGVGKRDDEIECALDNNIFSLIVESAQELDAISSIAQRRGTTARIFLRINPDIDAQTHPYISTGLRLNKFGISIDHAPTLISYAVSLPGIEVAGVHMHLGSQITTSEPYRSGAQALVGLVHDLQNAGIHLNYIDIGGGFGVRYVDALSHPALPTEDGEAASFESATEILSAVKPILASSGCTVIIEPGRYLVAESGVLLTRVLFTKETGAKKFVVVDAAMTELIRPSLYHAYHQIVPIVLSDGQAEVVDVVGPVCESSDFLAKDRMMKSVRRGDIVAVLTAGAYGYVLASNYNARLRPAEILVEGTAARVIRRREKIEDLMN
jgi:diaminopimelate decarboxylase